MKKEIPLKQILAICFLLAYLSMVYHIATPKSIASIMNLNQHEIDLCTIGRGIAPGLTIELSEEDTTSLLKLLEDTHIERHYNLNTIGAPIGTTLYSLSFSCGTRLSNCYIYSNGSFMYNNQYWDIKTIVGRDNLLNFLHAYVLTGKI